MLVVERLKSQALANIDRKMDELTRLCSELLQIPSANPPGDTSKISEFVIEYLESKDLKTEKYSPKKGCVNVVSVQGTDDSPSLVMNGHLDVFPAVERGWSFPPLSGEVREGKILGRGATDMKGGVAASLFAYSIISELDIKIPGRLALSLVADEMSGGRWGTEWLLNNVPALSGDACLIAEPGGTDSLVIGEKGRCQFRVKAFGVAGHSPMPIHTENAIVKMANLIPAIETLKELQVDIPDELREIIRDDKAIYDLKIGEGAGNALDHLTVNVGIIRGGHNINTVPDECEIDVDVTMPPGITPEQTKGELDSRLRLAKTEQLRCEFIKEYPFHRPALYTPITEKIARLTYDNVTMVTGSPPTYFIKQWGTDGKFFRKRGIPTIIYGPSEMTAVPDEYVLVKELCDVTKVHAATALDFLFREPN